ncbi:hypothetical protein CXF68_17730 [Tenacibaculum sp. Bg11-29]|uniref:hypothetical protein n=1 Tax=Tenacibaculum sp. Bg11-29 TaxID=2058306 RepID=UPI000C33EDD4|nr:hypothetical protein [Tenacibaculum sp. Bg11-29]PKH52419.1 hypothetical protein CXF68_17730 [Tenacibaculum sp. Bg11-29]
MKILSILKFLILCFFVSSCTNSKKNKWKDINVKHSKNDSIVFEKKVSVNTNYDYVFSKDDFKKIIKSQKTFEQIHGEYSIGFIEKEDPFNKAFGFVDSDTLKMPNLENENSLYDFCLLEEIKKEQKQNSEIKCILSEYFNATFGENFGKYLNFIFTDEKSDTIGIQNSYYVNIRGKMTTIHILTRTNKKTLELQKLMDDFGNKAKR